MSRCISLSCFIASLFVIAVPARAEPAISTEVQREAVVSKAVAFLKAKGQAANGSFSAASGPGVTALVTTGLLRNGVTADDPTVAKSLAYLETFLGEDGGLNDKESLYRNYETCLAIMCLQEANTDGRYTERLRKMNLFVKNIQWDDSEGKNKEDLYYGGAGYGKHKRPDLSNTSFLVDALKAAGNTADDEAIQRALVFVSRSQNLESEFNSAPFAAKNPDGGFYYTPAAGGQSMAGPTENGGLRSYGSMTYAGLKSLIYAGLKPNDPRVKAALTWLKKNYNLEQNPGMGQQGLYYYYHTFAKCLHALGEDTFEDAAGVKHVWRAELVAKLASLQKPDGSFLNEAEDRWMEGDPNLATGYVLLALSYAKK